MKIKDILTDESKWCKVYEALDKDENSVSADNPNACRWCLYGAIRKSSLDSYTMMSKVYLIEKKIKERLGNIIPIGDWNDKVEFEEIKDLITELDL